MALVERVPAMLPKVGSNEEPTSALSEMTASMINKTINCLK
jgi:hypothetical protein